MNYNNDIIIFKSTNELSDFIGRYWSEQISKLSDNVYYSIALSGGSTPIKIFEYLSKHYRNKIEWKKIKFFWGDERCVPPTDLDSNFKLAKDFLFNHVDVDEENIFRIKGEVTPTDEAENYSKILSENLASNNGYPQFDFILLGLGEDGHTASIFPNQIELFNSKKYCEVAEHPITGKKRITITGKIINNGKTVAIVAVGYSKIDVIFEILHKEGPANVYPANFVCPKDRNLLWLLDEKSGTRLPHRHKKQSPLK